MNILAPSDTENAGKERVVLNEKSAAADQVDVTRLGPFSATWQRRIVIAAIIAFFMKVFLAWVSPGTRDVGAWEQFALDIKILGGLAVYHKPYILTSFFNHPPFILHLVGALGWMSEVTGLPLRFLLRVLSSIADMGSVFLLWQILQKYHFALAHGNKKSASNERAFSPGALLLFAVAPAVMGISGFHGNTDPIMMFFVLLSVFLLQQKKPIWLVGIAFGMSLNIKVASLVFVPVFLCFLPTWRQRIEYSIATALVFVCGGLPYLLQDPVFILHRVFGYGGVFGGWGISRLFTLIPELGMTASFQHFGRPILLISLFLLALWMNHPRHANSQKPELLRQLALLTLLFFVLTPAFGIQYLAWALPLMVALQFSSAAIFYVTSSLFLCLTYALAWQLYAQHKAPGPLMEHVLFTCEFLCWLSVAALFALEAGRLARERQISQSPKPKFSRS